MAYQYALACSAHTMLLIMLLQSSQPCLNAGIFLLLLLFRAECVVAEWVEAECLGLICVEVFRVLWRIGGLESAGGDSRHLGGRKQIVRMLCSESVLLSRPSRPTVNGI